MVPMCRTHIKMLAGVCVACESNGDCLAGQFCTLLGACDSLAGLYALCGAVGCQILTLPNSQSQMLPVRMLCEARAKHTWRRQPGP